MLRRFFLLITLCAAFLFSSWPAAAEEPVVVVVRVSGDGFDAGAIRAAIGKELDAVAVNEDDARATKASGWIDVERADDQLKVTYQKLGTPVTRSVKLPANPDAVKRIAVALAGNVARDEASEILAAKKEPEAPSPPTPPEESADKEAIETARLRTLLLRRADLERRTKQARGALDLAIGSALATGGILLLTLPRQPNETVGGAMTGFGIGYAGGGIITLAASGSSDHGELVAVLDKDGRAAALRKWREMSDSARSARHTTSVVCVVLGALAITTGVLVGANSEPEYVGQSVRHVTSEVTMAGALVFAGVSLVAIAPLVWFTESPVETSYNTYAGATGMSATSRVLRRARASATPTQGGGMVTLGLSF
jgi:hypothetical protein